MVTATQLLFYFMKPILHKWSKHNSLQSLSQLSSSNEVVLHLWRPICSQLLQQNRFEGTISGMGVFLEVDSAPRRWQKGRQKPFAREPERRSNRETQVTSGATKYTHHSRKGVLKGLLEVIQGATTWTQKTKSTLSSECAILGLQSCKLGKDSIPTHFPDSDSKTRKD